MPVEGAPEPFWPPPKGFLGPPQCVGYSLTDGTAIIAVHASREPLEFQGDIMHNKFAIVDGRAVWTGSCNLSDAGTGGYNANAAVIVHSDAVASWYSEEFERMFVSELFHRRKVGKVPQSVRTLNMADGESLEVAFSPQDSVYWNLIRPMLRSSKKSIDIGVFFLTHKLITADLIDAHQRGVKVRVIIDATAAKDDYTKHEILRVAGIPVKVENWGGKMHMKCALIDGRTLITGSMNWTSAGEYNNDENTIVINSERIGRQFASLYEGMWHSIPDRWLTDRPDPESFDSPASVADGIDNDFDNLVDSADPGCGKNSPPLLELPPLRVVPLTDGYDLIKGDISKDGQRIYYLPTDPYYRNVKITEASGERWFPSVWEAQEACWTHARNQE
ncbi:MAG: phospholipase D-like domain-containing protein [Anaerolineae bacterium]